MLRITPSYSAINAKSYFDESLARSDYYSEGQESPGTWFGKGAERLGLFGEATREAFHALCDNVNPASGEPLTPRNKEGRRVGYDFTFDCAKSLSLYYELTQDARVLDAFNAAVVETMADLEREVKTRIRARGENSERLTGELLGASFIHHTARPMDDGIPDPQLHAHCFVFNATWDPIEERFKAIDIADIKRDALFHQRAFDSRFARQLVEQGFAIDRTANGFELSGFDATTLEKFSRRTEQIEQEAARLGITDSDLKGELGARTRQKKEKGLSMSELRAEWRSRLTDQEQETITRVACGEVQSKSPQITVAQAIDHAILHSFERQSVSCQRRLMAEALKQGVGSVTVAEVQQEVKRPEIISREVDGRTLCTTREVMHEEQRMLDWCRSGRGSCTPIAPQGRAIPNPMLSAEQRAAATHVWTSTDRVILISGKAGTSKTTLMKEVVAGIEESGVKVFAFSPTAEASRGVQRSEGFANADTVARFLVDPDMQGRVKNSVIWIDEAGTLGVRQMAQLCDLAERQKARIIFTGDASQHNSVSRGDSFRILQEQAGLQSVSVVEIKRQKAEYKSAVASLAQGDMETGFAKLDAMGAIKEIEDRSERHKMIAADYLDSVEKRKKCLVVAPTHGEADAVTAAIRTQLKAADRLDYKEKQFTRVVSLNLTEAQRRDPVNYESGLVVALNQNVRGFTRGEQLAVVGHDEQGVVQVRRQNGQTLSLPHDHADRFDVYRSQQIGVAKGDSIRFTKNGLTNDKKHRLNNGATYTVEGFTRAGDIRLNNGWVVDKAYGHFNHGYCSTSYSSQGKTVDQVILAAGTESFGATTREQFYVSCSRGREGLRVYTDDRESLLDHIHRSSERMSAIELVSGQAEEISKTRPTRLREAGDRTARRNLYEQSRSLQGQDDRSAIIGRDPGQVREVDQGAGYER
jgi:conjugative relaxase-like TrwC/TraI family protein